MNLFLHRLYLQEQIADARQSAKDKDQQLQSEINNLKRKIDALTIGCQALWELLREKTGMTDEMILDKMQEIDLRDGREDGKISTTVSQCPNCGRGSNTSRKTCLYCGALLPGGDVFDQT